MKKCDSCGMPFDINCTSKEGNNYCIYCQDQQTGELKSQDQVREGSIAAVIQYEGKSRTEAERFVDETMAKLPRWQTGIN